MKPEEMEKALEVVIQPEFWCRSKLFLALRAAQQKNVLQEVLDEMDLDLRSKDAIQQHLEKYWSHV